MIYDVLIIGGGPAGMMAAVKASERGAHVLIIEKNSILGLKLLMTGGGRCNITNTSADSKQEIGVYGSNANFLFSAFNKFSVDDTMEFFRSIGVDLKIEEHGRVFPESNRAKDVQEAFIKYLKEKKVDVMFGAEVKEIIVKNKKIEKVLLADGREILAKNFIIATGGKSYPETGSNGDAYIWLKKLGHTINTPRPALSSIVVKEKIVKQLEGLSLKDLGLNIYKNNKKIISHAGDIIFTSDGLSGPGIIDLSSQIGLILSETLMLQIDFRPEINASELEKKIQNDFHHSNNKMFKNYLSILVSPKLVPVILSLSGVYEEKLINTITKDERKKLIRLLKEFTLEIKGLKGFDKAMITAGGVDPREINPKTMGSKLYQNLFLAGEVLDLDGPSGGYNLQICWSTAYTAGDSVSF